VLPIIVRVNAKTTLPSVFIVQFLRSRQAPLFCVTNTGVQDVGGSAWISTPAVLLICKSDVRPLSASGIRDNIDGV